MNLFIRAARSITQEHQIAMERLNQSFPSILQAEQLAHDLTEAGMRTNAGYSTRYGTQLKAEVPIECLQEAIATLHTVAEASGRTVVSERSSRFVLVVNDHGNTEHRPIELIIEEI